MAYDPNWECYPLTSRPVGEESLREISHSKDRTVKLLIGGVERATLSERHRTYSYHYHRKSRLGDPWTDNLSGWVQNGGGGELTEDGSISETYSFLDTTIQFMDLRKGIVAFKEKTGSVQFSGTGNSHIGQCLIDDGFGLQTHNTMDVVGVSADHTLQTTGKNRIVVSTPAFTKELAIESENIPVDMNLGATDYSGWSGGLAYDFLPWGSYSIVDESKPYAIDNYTPLYELDLGIYPIDYFPSWIQVAEHQDIDSNDGALFADVYGSDVNRTDSIDIEVHSDPFPAGSWAVDQEGNIFISQLLADDTVYSVLLDADGNETNPVAVTETPGINPVFFPIAPT